MDPEKKEIIMNQLITFDYQFHTIQDEYIKYVQSIYDESKDKDIIGKTFSQALLFRKSQSHIEIYYWFRLY